MVQGLLGSEVITEKELSYRKPAFWHQALEVLQ